MVVMAACATPYQAKGFRGGYEETRLGADRWMINVEVNSYTSRSTAIEYTYRRAAELCPQGFDPIDADRSERVVSYNGQDYAKPNAVLVVQCKPPPTLQIHCANPSCT